MNVGYVVGSIFKNDRDLLLVIRQIADNNTVWIDYYHCMGSAVKKELPSYC
ncbi:hypothetical protein JV46_05040 [Solemya velum gill symbiont]|uniref:Uncharacterized protein n=1 Tax=Solemya velum gill symbiont TaxID=2340 RepID=A0A0B0H8S7_SOVGS|nr:hypothetical protein JV46_05040 [Solemya velum gill symbiont]